MAVIQVQVVAVLVVVLLESKVGVWKVEPWLCEEDEGRFFILEDF